MWVLSGVALHATVTVRAGRRAWAGCGESPCLDNGPAVIVNASATVNALTNSAVLLILHPSLGRAGEKVSLPPPLRNEGILNDGEGDSNPHSASCFRNLISANFREFLFRDCMKRSQTRTSRLVMRRIIAAYTNASPLAQSLS